MNRSQRILCLAIVALVSIGAFSVNRATGQGSGKGEGDPLAVYRKAGINGEQEARIRKLAKDFETEQRVRLQKLIGLMKDMKELQLQPNPNDQTVLAKQDEINAATSEMASGRVQLLLDIRKVLTPPQRNKLVLIISQIENSQQESSQGEP